MQFSSFSFNYSFVIIVILSLVGCSRDFELDIPDEFVDDEAPWCLKAGKSLFDISLISGVSFGDELVSVNGLGSGAGNTYSVNYLIDTLSLTAMHLSDITTNDLTLSARAQEELDKNSKLKFNLSDYVDKIDKSDADNPLLSLRSVSVTLLLNNKDVENLFVEGSFDESENLTNFDLDLAEGENLFEFEIIGSIDLLDTGLECIAVDENSDTRVVEVTIPVEFTIVRASVDSPFEKKVGVELATDIGESGDRFGAIAGHSGDILVVGVPQDDSSAQGIFAPGVGIPTENEAINSGAAHVYRLVEGEYEHLAYLKSSNSDPGDLFGSAVSIDGNTIIVSAPGESSSIAGVHQNTVNSDYDTSVELDNSSPSSGAIYIFELSGDTVEQTAFIKPSEITRTVDDFDNGYGSTVLLRDGTFLVTAPKYERDLHDANSGAVFVYEFLDNKWVMSGLLRASLPGENDNFGHSVARDGEFIVVGVPLEDSAAGNIINDLSGLTGEEAFEEDHPMSNNTLVDSGGVYIFRKQGDNWSAQSFIKPSNVDSFDHFGASVSIYRTVVAIGAVNEDGGGVGSNRDLHLNNKENSGAVYLYAAFEDEWRETGYIKGPATQAGAKFGTAIEMDGNDLVISASFRDQVDGDNVGSVYLFSGSLAGCASEESETLFLCGYDDWVHDLTIDGSSENTGGLGVVSEFGRLLDLDESSLLIGAPAYSDFREGSEKSNSGKLFLYD